MRPRCPWNRWKVEPMVPWRRRRPRLYLHPISGTVSSLLHGRPSSDMQCTDFNYAPLTDCFEKHARSSPNRTTIFSRTHVLARFVP